jgi:hypothetical protein
MAENNTIDLRAEIESVNKAIAVEEEKWAKIQCRSGECGVKV